MGQSLFEQRTDMAIVKRVIDHFAVAATPHDTVFLQER
jgi:hypothetical protein